MNDLFGVGGGKPKLITVITSGTGTYVPTENNARCLIRRQGAGGGAGGGQAGCGHSGGGGGAFVETMERVPIAGYTYSVGAKGIGGTSASGTDGGATRFNNVIASGGKGGISTGGLAVNGVVGTPLITGDVGTGNFGQLSGVSGGASGNGSNTKGYAPGFYIGGALGNGQSTGSANTSGGGDSFRGKGGNGGLVGTDGGTGAGGGGSSTVGAKGGDGGGGELEIWDYGA